MATCETCGNDYDKAFQVVLKNGEAHTFDSFECAIHASAPRCKHCGIRIIGHGLEKDGIYYCCDHCAEKEGVTQLRDRCRTATVSRCIAATLAVSVARTRPHGGPRPSRLRG